jgi:hypothetical protein
MPEEGYRKAAMKKTMAYYGINVFVMGTQQLHSSVRLRSLVAKKRLAKQNVMALQHPPNSPDSSPPDFLLFPRLKSVLKGHQFASAEEITAKATEALTEESENVFQVSVKIPKAL